MEVLQSGLTLLAEKIKKADAIVIGGGSGLSSAAGYNHYHWSPALAEALAPFREQYGFRSPLDGYYHCFSSYEEQWGYYSQYIRFMLEGPTGTPYLDLREVVGNTPYFVLTTNIDGQFYRVFPAEQICSYQGDFRFYQCGQPCRDMLYDARELVDKMSRHLIDGVKISKEAIPRCPECGRVMVPWVRDDTFSEGAYWNRQVANYHAFLRHWLIEQKRKNILLLELGVGEMTPSIIKLPFWELAAKNENVFYACLNREASHAPEHLKGRNLYLQGDLAKLLHTLRETLSKQTEHTR